MARGQKRSVNEIYDLFICLSDAYDAIGDTRRRGAFLLAGETIKNLKEISCGADIAKLKGCGKASVEVVDEFIKTGKCIRLDELTNDESNLDWDDKVNKRAMDFGEKHVAETKLDATTYFEDVRLIDRCCEVREYAGSISRKPLKKWEEFSDKHHKEAKSLFDTTSQATLYFLHRLLEADYGTVTEEYSKKEMCHECEMSLENNNDGGLCNCEQTRLLTWFEGVPDLPDEEPTD